MNSQRKVVQRPILMRRLIHVSFILAMMLVLGLPVAAMADPVFGEPRQLTFTPDEYEGPIAWSPDGARILMIWEPSASTYPRSTIGFLECDSLSSMKLHEGDYQSPQAWSPNGQQIAFTGLSANGRAIWVMNADGSNAHVVPGTESGDPWECEFSPDGRYLLYTANNGAGAAQAARISILGGSPEFLGETGIQPHSSPDGTLIGLTQISSVRIIDLGDPSSGAAIPATPGWYVVCSPRWSASGSKMVWLEWDGGVQHQIWTANGDGSDPRLLTTTINLDDEPQISHDGQFVAWPVSKDDLAETWIMVQSTSGGEAVRLPNVTNGGYAVWSTVSNTLAYRSRMADGDDVFAVEVASDPSALIPIGTDVRAATGTISVLFPSVSVAGALTVTPSTPRHADPANFRLLPNMYYDIHPTATFAGPATVTLAVPDDYDGDLAKLKVFHWKDSGWETLSPTVNAAAWTLTFQTDSFSDFGVAEPSEATGSPTEVSTPASSNWSVAAFAVLLSAMFAIVYRRRLGTCE